MKKFVVVLLLMFVILPVGAFADEDIAITINNKPYISDVQPIKVNGSVLVPLRSIFKAFEQEVTWLPDTQEIVTEYKGKETRFTVGSKYAICMGEPTYLSTAPLVRNGVTFIPLRAVSTALEKHVDYTQTRILRDNFSHSVNIRDFSVEKEPFVLKELPPRSVGRMIPAPADAVYEGAELWEGRPADVDLMDVHHNPGYIYLRDLEIYVRENAGSSLSEAPSFNDPYLGPIILR